MSGVETKPDEPASNPEISNDVSTESSPSSVSETSSFEELVAEEDSWTDLNENVGTSNLLELTGWLSGDSSVEGDIQTEVTTVCDSAKRDPEGQPQPCHPPTVSSPQQDQPVATPSHPEETSDKDEDLWILSTQDSAASLSNRFRALRITSRRLENRIPKAGRNKFCGRPLWCSNISLSASIRRMYKARERKQKAILKARGQNHPGPIPKPQSKPVDVDQPPGNPEATSNDMPICSLCAKKQVPKKLTPVSKDVINRRGRSVLKLSLYARRKLLRNNTKCVCNGKLPAMDVKPDSRLQNLSWVWGEMEPAVPLKAKFIHHGRNFYKAGYAKMVRLSIRLSILNAQHMK